MPFGIWFFVNTLSWIFSMFLEVGNSSVQLKQFQTDAQWFKHRRCYTAAYFLHSILPIPFISKFHQSIIFHFSCISHRHFSVLFRLFSEKFAWYTCWKPTDWIEFYELKSQSHFTFGTMCMILLKMAIKLALSCCLPFISRT